MAPTAWVRCLSSHVLLVSLNPSSERTSHLWRNECPEPGSRPGPARTAHGNDRSPQLSLSGLHCNLAAVSADPEIGRHGASWPSNSAAADSLASAELRG